MNRPDGRLALVVTLEQARAAKEALRDLLNRPPWLRGIGLSQEGGELVIQVNVDRITDAILEAIPRSIDGVRVFVDAVGDIVPSKATRLGK